MKPAQFMIGTSLKLTWDHRGQETTHWELFRGQALDHTKTREKRTFESWNIWQGDTAGTPQEPMISVKLDLPGRRIHVTRSIACRGHESYTEGNAILSRENVRRVRELVGSIDLDRLATCTQIQDELTALLFFAIVGASRLPLTSLEAPLPAFTFGQLAYCFCGDTDDPPIESPEDLVRLALRLNLSPLEMSRALEAALRAESSDRIPNLAESFAAASAENGIDIRRLPALLREVFNNVALSPYNDFVAKALRFAGCLLDGDDEACFLTHLLRQLGRHLTSFNLVRFHHRGANYPDALLLEEVISRVAAIVDQSPQLFVAIETDHESEARRKRLRRRGLRSAWLICRQYHGHPVPDSPTSPGENNRVLPEPFASVPDEQIADSSKRRKRLFLERRMEGSATMRELLLQSVADLEYTDERLELGLGLFLDRPFGFAKSIGEPDRTTLLSHEAFSLEIARQRLNLLSELGDVRAHILQEHPDGVSSWNLVSRQRPGVASIADAKLAAGDFKFVRTTRRTLRDLLATYEFSPLHGAGIVDWLQKDSGLAVPSPDSPDQLCFYDSHGCVRLRVQMNASQGYRTRAGVEALAAGLNVVVVKDDNGELVPGVTGLNLPSRN